MRRAPLALLTLLALAATPAVAAAETVEAESLAIAGAVGAPYAEAAAGEGRALLSR